MLPGEANLYAMDMSQINTFRLNCNKANLKASRKKYQSPPGMVLPQLKVGNFDWFGLAFQQVDRRLVGITKIPLDYVLRYSEVGNYRAYWYIIEERLKKYILFKG